MDGEKKGLTKKEKEDILWTLDYVAKSVKSYGEEPTFDREFYIKHLSNAIENLKGDQK